MPKLFEVEEVDVVVDSSTTTSMSLAIAVPAGVILEGASEIERIGNHEHAHSVALTLSALYNRRNDVI